MEQQELIWKPGRQDMPLATRMRPRTLEGICEGSAICSARAVLRQLIERPRVFHDFLGAAGRG